MTLINTETGITIDGVALNTLAKSVETKSGRLVTPGVRGSNNVINASHGSVWGKKVFDEGKIILPIWVLGCDDDGNVPTNRLNEFYKNKDAIHRLLGKRHGLLDVRATQPDASVRQALCEALSPLDLAMFNREDARMNIELVIPGSFWQDPADLNWNSAFSSGTVITAMGGTWGIATAPTEDAQSVLKCTAGTLTNPRITDMTSGTYVQFNGTLTAGGAASDWYVHGDLWASRTKSAAQADWDNTVGTNVIATTSKSVLSSRFVSLTPDNVTGTTSVSVTGAWSGGAAATLYVRGRRKFLS